MNKKIVLTYASIMIVLLSACSNTSDKTKVFQDSTYENGMDDEDNNVLMDINKDVNNDVLNETKDAVNQEANQETNQAANQEANQEANQGANQIANQAANQIANQEANQVANQVEEEDKGQVNQQEMQDGLLSNHNNMTADNSVVTAENEKIEHDKLPVNQGDGQGDGTVVLAVTDIDKEKAVLSTISSPENIVVKSSDPTLSSEWIPVSPDHPLYVESSLSEISKAAVATNVPSYQEHKYNVLNHTYDCVDGCWRFTKSAQHGFYFYSMNDDNYSEPELPKMKRSYLSGDEFKFDYLDSEDFYYAPYEDEAGNIYAEIGRYVSGGHAEKANLAICKMDSDGNTLVRLNFSDVVEDGFEYKGFAYIKENVIALVFHQSSLETSITNQVQIIDLQEKKLLTTLDFQEPVLTTIKSDGDYFAVTSASYQRVYVFDSNTFQLVNTVDTTKCKELCVYEWKVNDWEVGKYTNLSYDIDLKDGTIYFLRHSGVYVTDCMKSEFFKVLDGNAFADFRNQLYKYTSFYVGDQDDFYLLGVNVDEESATNMWRYTRN